MDQVTADRATIASSFKKREPWAAVAVLTLLYILNRMDAIILAPLGTPIKLAFGLTDFQFSLLAGPSFAIFYGLCGVPMGAIVDRQSIRKVVFVGIIVWSVATGACGLATGYLGLTIARMMVGAGDAALTPAAYLMISTRFARERRTLPLSIYGTGASIGIGLGIGVGGYAAGVSMAGGGIMLPILGWTAGWKVAFLTLSLVGLLLSPLAFTIPDADRTVANSDAVAETSASSIFAHIRSDRRFLPLFILFLAMSTATVGSIIWLPTFLTRIIHIDHAASGAALGSMLLFGGITGHMLSGFGIDWYHRRGGQNGSAKFAVLASVISLPAMILAVLLDDPILFWPLAVVFYTLFVPWSAYGVASMLEITPPALRGRVGALFLLVCSAGGSVLGPTLTGAMTDYLFVDEMKLGQSLALLSFVSLVVILAVGRVVLRNERAGLTVKVC